MVRKCIITAIVGTLAFAPAAGASVLDRWKDHLGDRTKLLKDARARHQYWDTRNQNAPRDDMSERWKTRNMKASRRQAVEHRAFQVAFAERVVARHTPRAARPVSSGGHSGPLPPAYIKACESGGSYSARNPSSGAYGAWQVLPSTHAAICPELGYSPWEQDECAARILKAQGLGAWVCA